MSEGQLLIQILLIFAVFWIALMFFSARVGGWKDLARVYRASRPFEGTRWLFQFIAMRYYWGYGLVTIGASSEGLSLSVLAAGEVQGHPPLFIPWAEVAVDEPEHMKRFYQAELRFRQAPDVRVRINRSLLAKLRSVHPELA